MKKRFKIKWIVYLQNWKLGLHKAQNGFKKGKSIDTAVQSFIGRIQKALDKQYHTIQIFIDLTKTYDIFNHKLLLGKLFYYGIRSSINL